MSKEKKTIWDFQQYFKQNFHVYKTKYSWRDRLSHFFFASYSSGLQIYKIVLG